MNEHDMSELAYTNGYNTGLYDAAVKFDVFLPADYGPVTNAKVFGLCDSIKRAKFPMSVDISKLNSNTTSGIEALATSAPGSGHDQFLTGIIVQFDLTLSNKCWPELQRYHFFDFVSSQSTMHRITKFNLDESYLPQVDKRIIEIMKEKVREYEQLVADNAPEDERQQKYLEVLYNNPAGFMLTAGMTTNYRQLKTVYRQRKDHRLPEWRDFCKWIEMLPESWMITGARDDA